MIDTATNQQYRTTIYRTGTNSERLFLEYKAFKAHFFQDITRLLDTYGLAARLDEIVRSIAAGDNSKPKLRVLNVSCAEGLYLHGLAELLEARGWEQAVEFYGVDQDATMIGTAFDYATLSNPPRPYFNFYCHDYNLPFTNFPGKSSQSVEGFDLIFFSIGAAGLTPGMRPLLHRLYAENLNPGGVVYLREFIQEEGPNGWTSVHPAMEKYFQVSVGLLKSFNEDEVARSAAQWLDEEGAQNIQVTSQISPCGGPTEEGRNFLRDMILSARIASPQLIQYGLFSQAEYDNMMQTIFAELTPEHIGQITYLSTFAQKP